MDNLSIIWWNTSLSPPVSSLRGVSSDQKKSSIASLIKYFMELEYEFICLGEVSYTDLQYFDKEIVPQQLGYYCAKGVDQVGRLYFDTCIYYRKLHKLIRHDSSDVSNFFMRSGSRSFKYGQKYKFDLSTKEKMIFYLSHWPSQINNVDLQIASVAERLRTDIENELPLIEHIVLIGDYNVEPYDKAIVHHLQSSREKQVVLKKPNVLYNPCWKFLTVSQTSDPRYGEGTYYYSNGNFHHWYAIDQIMFSKVFLTSKWNFKDDSVTIVVPNYLISTQNSFHNESDHYPLSAVIARNHQS
jgi:hypothetical protein